MDYFLAFAIGVIGGVACSFIALYFQQKIQELK